MKTIKKLGLTRETVKTLKVRANIRTGGNVSLAGGIVTVTEVGPAVPPQGIGTWLCQVNEVGALAMSGVSAEAGPRTNILTGSLPSPGPITR